MEQRVRRLTPLFLGIAFGVMCALAVAPTTGSSTREKLGALCRAATLNSLSLSSNNLELDLMETSEALKADFKRRGLALANQYPGDLIVQLGAAALLDYCPQLDNWSSIFPTSPEAVAAAIRYGKGQPPTASTAGMPFGKSKTRETTEHRLERGRLLLQHALAGERLAPSNGYFPMVRASALLLLDRPQEAAKALAVAAYKQDYDTYASFIKFSRDSLAARLGSMRDIRTRLSHSAFDDQNRTTFVGEAAAKLAEYATSLEKSGKTDEGARIRLSIGRCALLIARRTRDVESFTIASIVSSWIARGAKQDGSSSESARKRDATVYEAIQRHLLAAGRDKEAAEVPFWRERVQSVVREAFNNGDMLNRSGLRPLERWFGLDILESSFLVSIFLLAVFGGLAQIILRPSNHRSIFAWHALRSVPGWVSRFGPSSTGVLGLLGLAVGGLPRVAATLGGAVLWASALRWMGATRHLEAGKPLAWGSRIGIVIAVGLFALALSGRASSDDLLGILVMGTLLFSCLSVIYRYWGPVFTIGALLPFSVAPFGSGSLRNTGLDAVTFISLGVSIGLALLLLVPYKIRHERLYKLNSPRKGRGALLAAVAVFGTGGLILLATVVSTWLLAGSIAELTSRYSAYAIADQLFYSGVVPMDTILGSIFWIAGGALALGLVSAIGGLFSKIPMSVAVVRGYRSAWALGAAILSIALLGLTIMEVRAQDAVHTHLDKSASNGTEMILGRAEGVAGSNAQ